MANDEEPNIEEAERRIATYRPRVGTVLDLTGLGLREIPDAVRDMYLFGLNVGHNKLLDLPDWIGSLYSLEQLKADSNPGLRLTPALGSLHALTHLWLDDSDSTGIEGWIGRLISLRSLTLVGTGLRQVPTELRKLRKLNELYLSANSLSDLPEWLGDLPELEFVSVSWNNLRSLPMSLLRHRRLATLLVDGNPLGVPQELALAGHARPICDYLLRIADPASRRPLNEFKLILVGRGGSGKTSLVHRLVTNEFERFDRTPGVKVTDWPLNIDGDTIHAHVWDFGGQEILHGTHRFFLTERAVYLVLLTGREGTEDADADYWLQMVRSFGGDAPVIVLLHKQHETPFQLNRTLLRDKFGDVQFIETDSEDGHGIADLRAAITGTAAALPGLRAAWPAVWHRVKEELPQQPQNYLTYADFQTFCAQRGVPGPADQEELARTLHTLGIMLSYRQDTDLCNVGVLNPMWVTTGIYSILTADSIRKVGGILTVERIGEILPADQYPAELHPFLLALMRRFRLCHPLKREGHYLVPELLSKEEPVGLDSDFPPDTSLSFVYRYGRALPEGLLSRFIVESYVLQAQPRVWRTGVVLERSGCRAVVRGDVQGREITVRIVGSGGKERRELLAIIRQLFEGIHAGYERLPVEELVPITNPHMLVPYGTLLAAEQANMAKFPYAAGGAIVFLDVRHLLDGADIPGAREARRHANDRARDTVKVFISYSQRDDTFLDQLRAALIVFERVGSIEVWVDRRLTPGQEWSDELFRRLDAADVVFFLLSNHFFATDFCMKEADRVLERRKSGGRVEILPVLVRPTRYDVHPIGALQVIQPNRKSISQHSRTDGAWIEVTKHLDAALARLRATAAKG